MKWIDVFSGALTKEIELNEYWSPCWVKKDLDWNTAILIKSSEMLDATDWQWWDGKELAMEPLRKGLVSLVRYAFSKYYSACYSEHSSSGIDVAIGKFSQTFFQGIIYGCAHPERNIQHWLKQVSLGAVSENSHLLMSAIGSVSASLSMTAVDLKRQLLIEILLSLYKEHFKLRNPTWNYPAVINEEVDGFWFANIIDGVLSEHPEIGIDELEAVSSVIMNQTCCPLERSA